MEGRRSNVEITSARYDALASQLFGEVGYATTLGRIAVEPFAGLAWVHLNAGAFTEAVGAAALIGQAPSQDVGYSSLGIRMAQEFARASGQTIVPHLTATGQHAFGNAVPTTMAFANPGIAFASAGLPLARDAAVIDAGVDLKLGSQIRIGLSWFGHFGLNLTDNAIKGSFRHSF